MRKLNGELKRYFVISDRKYVGGAYGKTNEYEMMKELNDHGPVVVSFEPDEGFQNYSSGVYTQADFKGWKMEGGPQPEWLKVDHSVLLYGWGYEDKPLKYGNVCSEKNTCDSRNLEAHCECKRVKYWKLVNSWGSDWGEKNGTFRMERGIDLFGIESIAESARIQVVTDKDKIK